MTDPGQGAWSDPPTGGESTRTGAPYGAAPSFTAASAGTAVPAVTAPVADSAAAAPVTAAAVADPVDAAPVVADPSGTDPASPAAVKPPHKPTAALGWMALGIAALFAVADVVAIILAVQRSWETATLIAQASNLGTAIAFIAGLYAIRHRPGRRLGIAAIVLAVIANPFILTHLLAFLGGS